MRQPLIRVLTLLTGARRQFNLPRWTGRREFRDVHSTAVTWLDSHFELIEDGAPWLNAVGRRIRDFCTGRVRGWEFTIGSVPVKATAGCRRQVTAVYGFDGPLTERIRSLGQALPAAGWELSRWQAWQDFDPATAAAAVGLRAQSRVSWMTDRTVGLTWQPTEALSLPANLERMRPAGRPPLTPTMRVSWASRGQRIGWVGHVPEPGTATRNFLPIEVNDARVPDLVDQALARCEHALAVTIDLSYYTNPNPRAWFGGVPRYLLPTRAQRRLPPE